MADRCFGQRQATRLPLPGGRTLPRVSRGRRGAFHDEDRARVFAQNVHCHLDTCEPRFPGTAELVVAGDDGRRVHDDNSRFVRGVGRGRTHWNSRPKTRLLLKLRKQVSICPLTIDNALIIRKKGRGKRNMRFIAEKKNLLGPEKKFKTFSIFIKSRIKI